MSIYLIFNYLLFVVILTLALPTLVYIVQVLFAVFSKPEKTHLSSARPSVSVLMPAHNEELVIEQSIKTIMPQLQANDSLLVIADNCSDRTATIANAAGANVLERFNENERGKGYALDFGLKHLEIAPKDVVIIIDADCIVEPNCLQQLAKTSSTYQRPVQALYLMESQPNPSIKQRVATFAWVVKNMVRPLGFSHLRLPCQLMGTGMAFLWKDISQVNMASGHIVEDMQLGVDLARVGKAPLFLFDAKVTSVFPPNIEGVKTQRARWEHGHLSVIVSEVPRLIYESIKTKNLQLLGMALDLLVPPLAMLFLMCVTIFTVSMLFAENLIILLACMLLTLLGFATFLAWYKFGRNIISFNQLCYAPVYALIKIPLYIKFFLNRQVEWVRSKRD